MCEALGATAVARAERPPTDDAGAGGGQHLQCHAVPHGRGGLARKDAR